RVSISGNWDPSDPNFRASVEALAGTGPRAMREFAREVMRLLELYDQAIARARELAELEVERLGEDLQVRLLRARGQDDMAAFQELVNRQERERLEIMERYGDILPGHVRDLLDLVEAEERLALIREQEAERARQLERFVLDVAGIRAELSGDD